MLIFLSLKPTMIRLTEEQRKFIEEKKKSEKGWTLSNWFRGKLFEEMEKNPFYLKRKLEEIEKEKILTAQRLDEEKKHLKKELAEAEEREKQRKERLEQFKPKPRIYGDIIPKSNKKERDQ